MSGPVRGTIYVHIPSGERFRYVGVSAATGGVVLTRISEIVDPDFYVACVHAFHEKFAAADDLLAVAEAMGVAAPQDQGGRQPLAEFTSSSPLTHPELFDDENLARVFGLDKAAGGGS
jgi:hypothetical protein